jgi:hypothetical protein
MDIPQSLRRAFVLHAIVDLVIGLPLLIAPGAFLAPLGWTTVDPASARLVAAALVAIGAKSYSSRHAGLESYRTMLDLKLVWSAAAIFGLVLSIGEGAPAACWIVLALFVAFFGVWTHYRIRMKQMARADALDDTQPIDDPDAEGDARNRPGGPVPPGAF